MYEFINRIAALRQQLADLTAERDEAQAAAQHFHDKMVSIDRNIARGWRSAYTWLKKPNECPPSDLCQD